MSVHCRLKKRPPGTIAKNSCPSQVKASARKKMRRTGLWKGIEDHIQSLKKAAALTLRVKAEKLASELRRIREMERTRESRGFYSW